MHIKAKPLIFLPSAYWSEIEKLSKAALMDLVWDYATTAASNPNSEESIIAELRNRATTIKYHRHNEH